MKKLLLALSFVAMSAFASNAGVYVEESVTDRGVPIVRIANALDVMLSCYIQDRHNYIPFYVYPRSYSLWYPVSGQYVWECHY